MIIELGTSDSDAFFGENGDDFFDGVSGDDIIIGGYHDDSLHGGSGDDFLTGGYHDDTLHGGSGDDLLRGGYHDDVLFGDSGDDLLLGGNHNDFLDGGSGNDSLEGGTGQDTLVGGEGADTFIFNSLESVDVIGDFDQEQGDKIVFDSATGITEIGNLTVHVGASYQDGSELDKVTSLYVGEVRIIEFDRIVSLQAEDFRFI